MGYDLQPLILMQDNPCPGLDGDGLDLSHVADTVAGAAIGNEGPFTIGVFGPWGSGKTSLLNLAREMVEDRSDPGSVTVWFNAWQHEREPEPLFPLIAAVVESIAERNSKLKNAAVDAVTTIGGVLYGLFAALKVKADFGMEGGLKVGGDFDAEKFLKNYEEFIKEDNPLPDDLAYSRAFKFLSDKSKEGGFKIVVFIDDLDRCDPEKAVRLLESIKLILNQPGFVFVIALADNVVTKYLQFVYTDKFKLDPEKLWGESYLEKIVNLPVRVPSHRRTFERYAESQVVRLAVRHQLISSPVDPKWKQSKIDAHCKQLSDRVSATFFTRGRMGNIQVDEAHVEDYCVEVRTLAAICQPLASGASHNPRQFVRLGNGYLLKTRLWQRTHSSSGFSHTDALVVATDVILEARMTEDDLIDLADDQDLCEDIYGALTEFVDRERARANETQLKPRGEQGLGFEESERNEAISLFESYDQWPISNEERQMPDHRTALKDKVLDIFRMKSFGRLRDALLAAGSDNWFMDREKRDQIRYLSTSQTEANDGVSLHPALETEVRQQLSLDVNEPVTIHHCRQIEALDMESEGLKAEDCLELARLFVNLTSLDLAENQIGDVGVEALAESTNLVNLTSLHLNGNQVGEVGAKALAESKNLANLTTLNLDDNEIGDAGVVTLAESTNLINLTSLSLNGNQVGDVGANALAESKTFANLTTLFLFGNHIGDVGAEAIAESTTLVNLTRLYLDSNQIGEAGATTVAESTTLANLTTLGLSGNEIGDAGVKALAESTALANLSTLAISGNEIGHAGAKALAESTTLTRLNAIYLSGNEIGEVGAKALARSTTLTSLATLYFNNTKIGDAGVKALAESTSLANLTMLALGGNEIGDAGAKALAESTTLTRLVQMNLNDNQIGNVGAKALADSTTLTNLARMNLNNNRIGNVGAKALAKSTTLTSLTRLNLRDNRIGEEVRSSFRTTLNGARIHY